MMKNKCREDTVEIVAQINGKVRAKLTVSADIAADEAIALAKAESRIAEALPMPTSVKEFYVKGKLVNLVIRPPPGNG
jgi:leucyl-tRNA synthetase